MGSGDPAAQEIREVEGTWAEGGIFVDWFNYGDSIVLNYFAQKAGTYTICNDVSERKPLPTASAGPVIISHQAH